MNDPKPQEELARLEQAWRELPVPDGPSAEVLQQTLAAMQSAESASPTTLFWRKPSMRLTINIAVSVLLIVGVGLFISSRFTTANAAIFAEMAEKLRDAKILGFKMSTQVPQMKASMEFKWYFNDKGMARFEMQDQIVSIMDVAAQNILTLTPKNKTAILVTNKQPLEKKGIEQSATQFVDGLRQLTQKEGKSVGKKKIGSSETEGFLVQDEQFELTIWVDLKSKNPIQVDAKTSVGGQLLTCTMSEFELDAKLDENAFKLEAPEGYKILKMELENLTPEQDVTRILKFYTKYSGGTFPKKLDDWKSYTEMIAKNHKKGEELTSDELQISQSIGRVTALNWTLHDKYGYKTDGVKVGEKDKIIFWYKPEKATKYKALFADFHVEDVSADRLPQKLDTKK